MERLDDALKVYDEFLDNYPFNEEIKKDRDELFIKLINNIISSLFFSDIYLLSSFKINVV